MTDHSTLEERLARSLDRQAGGLHDTPFTVDDVRGRARSIRRHRRGVTAGVAAAVLAVAVPLGLLATGADDSRGVDPAPSPGLPRAAVLHGGELTLPDGSGVPVPYDDASQITTLADGRIVVMLQRRAVVLDAAGTELASYPVAVNELTAGREHHTVGWVGPGNRVQVLVAGQDEPVSLAAVPESEFGLPVVEMINGDECAPEICRITVGDGNALTYDVYVDEVVPATYDVARVTDVNRNGDRWAGAVPPGPDEQYGCSVLYDPVQAEIVAENCDTSGLRFSPDDRHLLGLRGDNNLYGEVTVLDADLRPVLTYEPGDDRVVSRAGWSDSTHLEVAEVDLDGGGWTLVRVALDGSSEVVEGPTAGSNPEIAADYVFAE